MSKGFPKKGRTGKTKPVDKVDRDYRFIDGHQCTLPIAENALSMYLNEGPCVLLRRRIKQMFLISAKLSKTKLFFRSSLRIGMEKQRHLRYFYYTIHPFSIFRFYWEIVMGIVYLTTIIFMPLYTLNTLGQDEEEWDDILYYIMNIPCFFDVIISCVTGYLDRNSETVVLNKKYIIRHYAMRYMFFDIAAAIPSQFIPILYNSSLSRWVWSTNRYLRISRLFTSINYLENLMDIWKMSHYVRTFIKPIVVLLVFIEYATFILVLCNAEIISGIDLWDYWPKIFVQMLHCTIKTIFLINPNHYGLSNTANILMIIHQFVLLHCGNLLNAFLLAMMLRIYNRTALVSRKHEYLARQIKEYAKYKELPDSMDRVLLQFVDFKFGRRIFNEDLITGTLTPHMKDELLFIYSKKLVESVQLFKEMPTSVIKRIAARLKPEILLPNDVIIQAGYEGSNMYFIIAGVVAVYTISGKEVCHLTDGAHFGEIALLMNETRTASIVAADFCELFKLNRKDFLEAIEPFPEIKEKMVQTAIERYSRILSFPNNDVADTQV